MTRREILRRYRHLRAIVTHHHSAALKFLTPAAIIERARRLGLAAGQALIADNEKEMTLLFDLVIYAAKEGRSRAIDRYAKAAQLPAGSDEALMLEAMRHAHFSLCPVSEVSRQICLAVIPCACRVFGGKQGCGAVLRFGSNWQALSAPNLRRGRAGGRACGRTPCAPRSCFWRPAA